MSEACQARARTRTTCTSRARSRCAIERGESTEQGPHAPRQSVHPPSNPRFAGFPDVQSRWSPTAGHPSLLASVSREIRVPLFIGTDLHSNPGIWTTCPDVRRSVQRRDPKLNLVLFCLALLEPHRPQHAGLYVPSICRTLAVEGRAVDLQSAQRCHTAS